MFDGCQPAGGATEVDGFDNHPPRGDTVEDGSGALRSTPSFEDFAATHDFDAIPDVLTEERDKGGLGEKTKGGREPHTNLALFRKGGGKPHTNRPTSDDGTVRDFKSPSCEIHDGAGSGKGAECKETLHSRDRAKRFTWANDAKRSLPREAQTSACKECLETRWRRTHAPCPFGLTRHSSITAKT